MSEKFKKIKELINVYFPDLWQYLVILLVMAITMFFVLR